MGNIDLRLALRLFHTIQIGATALFSRSDWCTSFSRVQIDTTNHPGGPPAAATAAVVRRCPPGGIFRGAAPPPPTYDIT